MSATCFNPASLPLTQIVRITSLLAAAIRSKAIQGEPHRSASQLFLHARLSRIKRAIALSIGVCRAISSSARQASSNAA